MQQLTFVLIILFKNLEKNSPKIFHKCVKMSDDDEIWKNLNAKIEEGNNLIRTLAVFKNISGIGKLKKKIQKELQFLSGFKENPNKRKLKVEHLQCSNLLHLSAIVQALENCQHPTDILKTFSNQDESKKLIVDIVCQGGFSWIKVIARSPAALERLSTGDQAYGQRSLIDQAKDYISATEKNLHHFKPPNLVFLFHAGVPENAAVKLKKIGIEVKGTIVPSANFDFCDEDEPEEEEEDNTIVVNNENHFHENFREIDYTKKLDNDDENILQVDDGVDNICKNNAEDCSILNLDITAMIAYVSALTNGFSEYEFKEVILNQQAAWERKTPVKPILDELFREKKLITCQAAMEDFQMILNTLGGPGEKSRAQEFLQRIEIVPDQMSDLVKSLKTGGKVRERSKIIFGTGDSLKVVTVSANSGFIRAAQCQNINLAVISHESRALTESKMITAKPL